ncbi:cyclin-D5-1-like protein [Carex littledalei]|uniref:Cyclin-D5-1-like protein n=1 Tax=Carex littledalei TaxID=544730 RepID=A0A833R6B0_9POAL|nr:cyclin-D5-1-like protein [Carex littledalei]
MEDGTPSSFSISNLMCQEDSTDLDFSIESERHNKICLSSLRDEGFSETEEKYIETLVSKEMNFCIMYRPCSSSCYEDNSSVVIDDWFKSVRYDAVQWILRTSIYFGMGFQTSYLAVTYLDRFSLRRVIDKEKPWAARLLSIACLSLAAKMEEYRAPNLSEYRSDGCEFSADSIQRMELLVLSTLDWRMSCISPFDYIRFFASKFDHDHGSDGLMIRAVQFVLSSLAGSSVLDSRPSTVATAAILAASNERLTKELVESKINNLSLSGYIEKEHVYACYHAMNQGSERSLKCSKRLASPISNSSIHDTIEGIDININTPSLSSNKRIRLHLPTMH